MLLVAVNVLILVRTHSPPAVAALWIVPQLALLGSGSVVGRLTDRWDKRRTLAVTNLAGGAVAVGLAMTPDVPVTYAVFGLFSVLGGMFQAAFVPYFRLLVPTPARPRANALQGAFQYGALVLGPALAGALLVRGRPDTVVWGVAGALVLSGALLFLAPALNVPLEAGARSRQPPSYGEDLAMVARFLRARPIAAGVMVCQGLLMVFGAAADAQEVVFAHRALHLAASGYGLLVSTAGIGYFAGAGVSWAAVGRTPVRYLMAVGEVFSGLGYLFYALSRGFIPAAAGLVVLGVAQAAASTGYGTFIQGALPPAAMGRITATLRSVFAGITVLATVAGGVLVQADGVRPWMVGASSVMVLAGLCLAVLCLSPGGRLEFQRASES